MSEQEYTHYAIVKLRKENAKEVIKHCFDRVPDTMLRGTVVEVGDLLHMPNCSKAREPLTDERLREAVAVLSDFNNWRRDEIGYRSEDGYNGPNPTELGNAIDAVIDYLLEFEAALAELSELRKASQWRPIESAPRDGTVIIVHGGVAYWNPAFQCWFSCMAQRPIQWKLTHWMPLPPPPAKETSHE